MGSQLAMAPCKSFPGPTSAYLLHDAAQAVGLAVGQAQDALHRVLLLPRLLLQI